MSGLPSIDRQPRVFMSSESHRFRHKINCNFAPYNLTCRLSALYPLPVAIDTPDAGAIVCARVVQVAVQSERD